MQSAHTRRASLLYAVGLITGAAIPVPSRAAEVIAWPPPRRAPAFSAMDPEGRTWTLADVRGKVVLLNFWATWCEPCRVEMPALGQLAASDQRIAVLSVNFKENASRAERFMRDAAPNVPILLDTDGSVAKAWGVKIFPTTVVIARDGQLRWRVRGEFDWVGDEASRLIRGLLK
ncbi:TlpA disulfide reductase family protein [Caenimonas sp. SL110]|uniref:TlpA family protein disulfide reductase n=1 Tax=Caenimonas sp. SL110 TaxID=1450524 RepID=UPI00137935AF|nr:TlpA disulfide reductase family protein [Caenimonas sp. SL110]